MLDLDPEGVMTLPNFRFGAKRLPLALATSLVLLMGFVGCGGFGGNSSLVSTDTGFAITVAPGSQTVIAGSVASFSVVATPATKIQSLNFNVSGLPPGLQASLGNMDPFTGTQKINILTTTTTPTGTSHLTITASDTKSSHAATADLVITPPADFTISVTPLSQTIRPGGSTSYTVTINSIGAPAGPVNLRVAGLPANATASFDHNSITGSGTAKLTITANSQIITVTSFLTVIGSDTTGSLGASFYLSIFPADFSLQQSVGPIEVNAGGTVQGQIEVAGLGGTPGTVTLSAKVPQGITATFNPATVTGAGASTITLATDFSTSPGDYNLEIDGVDSSGTNFTSVPITVATGNPGAGFFLTGQPIDQLVDPGRIADYGITANAPNGVIPPLTFTVSIPLSGVNGNVVPGNTPGSYVLVCEVSPYLQNTGTSVTVTALGPNGPQTLNFSLTVGSPPPDP